MGFLKVWIPRVISSLNSEKNQTDKLNENEMPNVQTLELMILK